MKKMDTDIRWLIDNSLFDEDWYLETYPDVAASEFNPLNHYVHWGRFEGRLPRSFQAVELANLLWARPGKADGELLELAESDMESLLSRAEAQIARWELAKFYSAKGDWAKIEQLLTALEKPDGLSLLRYFIPHQGPFLCFFHALLFQGYPARAKSLLSLNSWPAYDELSKNDKHLARSMVDRDDDCLANINKIYNAANLAELSFRPSPLTRFDQLTAKGCLEMPRWWQRRPKVSVIIPCFNCADTLPTAIRSIQNQSYKRLEIILVDDASQDDTLSLMYRIAADDDRVKVVSLKQNEGAYGARNAGLDVSSGELITTHDSDDWSHPDKIAVQVFNLLNNNKVVANRSAWVRADNKLNFSRWRAESSWIYPNISSLMYRRAVFKRLGYWDRVAADGDTEFYYRVRSEFGDDSIVDVLPAVPLAFGRLDQSSLTQASATHLSSSLGGVRASYQKHARQWHRKSERLYLKRYPNERAFLAPLTLCRGVNNARLSNELSQIKNTGLFNSQYYLTRYPDIAAAGVDPLAHYLSFGFKEGRDPSQQFSSSGYQFVNNLGCTENPLIHCIKQQEHSNKPYTAASLDQGFIPVDQRPLLMIFSHSSAGKAFGAERSLLDTLSMLREHFRLWVILPSAINQEHVKQIQRLSDKQSFLPIRWWQYGREIDNEVVDVLVEWMATVDLVYVNTLTLYEPHTAARQAGVPSLMHVRELPGYDPDLCIALSASADQIHKHAVGLADYFIANSQQVSDYLSVDNSSLIPNAIDCKKYRQAYTAISELPIRVGMISSNLAKKGIKDFYQLAASLYNNDLISWHLFGPHTEALEDAQASFPSTKIRLHGYIEDPVEALNQLDVVLVLSHFQESFGRSALEALAAGKIVIGYDWGAVPELINEVGILIPYKNVTAVKEALEALLKVPNKWPLLQSKALDRATSYDYDVVADRLVNHLVSLCR